MKPYLQNIPYAGNQVLHDSGLAVAEHGSFLFGNHAGSMLVDSAEVVIPVTNRQAVGHFLQTKSVLFHIIDHQAGYSYQITIFLLGLTLMLALIWFFFPERVYRLLSKEGSKHKAKYSNNQFAKPGILLYSLYIMTIVSVIGLFIYFAITVFMPEKLAGIAFYHVVLLLFVSVFLYFTFRFVIISFAGFLFNMDEQVARQMRAGFRIDLIISFLMIPVLIIAYNTPFTEVLYAGVMLMVVMMALKWIQTLLIGLKSAKISLYHNILYLCALEIIPVIILIKLIENYRIVFMVTN